MRASKPVYSELAIERESTSITYIWPKAGRSMGKLYTWKKTWLQACPDWKLSAWGSCRQANQKRIILCDWWWVYIWLSLTRASRVTQWIHLTMQETQETCIQSLGWEDPWRINGNPFQYSCLGNYKDRGAWRTIVHRVTKSQKWLSTHAQISPKFEMVTKIRDAISY